MSELQPKVSQGELHADMAYQAHAAEWDEMLAEREAELFNQQQKEAYEATQLIQTANGSLKDPATGHFTSPDKFHKARNTKHYEDSMPKAYEDMGILELGTKLAEAEVAGDVSTRNEIDTVLFSKLEKQIGDRSDKEGYNQFRGGRHSTEVSRPDAADHESDPADVLMDTVFKYVDKEKQRLIHEKQANETRNRIDEDYAADAMHTMKDAGVPDEIIKDIPAEYFYKVDDADKIDDTPEALKNWIAENPDVVDATKEEPAVDESEASAEEDVTLKTKEEIDEAKARLAEIDEELARLKQSEVEDTVEHEVVKKASWRSRLAFWKKRSNQDKYDFIMTPDRAGKYVAAGVGALATIVAGYAVAKGVHLGGNKSTHGAESVGVTNPFKGLGLKDMLELATGKTAKAAEHHDKIQHIHEAWKGTIHSGDGPTYVMQDMFNQKGIHLSPQQLHDVYTQHEDFFRSLGNTYTLPNGEVGFQHTGGISIPHEVMQQMVSDAKEIAGK